MRRAFILAALVVLAACSAGNDPELTVFAAASLQPALPPEGAAYSFGGSQLLVAQLEAGAKADVVVTADEATMQRLVAAGLVDPPTPVAANELAIVTRRDDVNALADLRNVSVVVADPSVPLGRLTAEALKKAGVTVTPKSLEVDAATTVQKVALGEVDAAVAYATDTARGLRTVRIPAEHNVQTRYMAAVLKGSGQPEGARAFIETLPAILERAGFLRP